MCVRRSCVMCMLVLQNQAGPDLNALFDTRTILRSSTLDNEANSDKVRWWFVIFFGFELFPVQPFVLLQLVLSSPPLASRKYDAMQGLMFSSAASKGMDQCDFMSLWLLMTAKLEVTWLAHVAGGAPAPASGPPVSKRGLTVREMLSSGAMLLAPPSGSVQST